MLRTFETHHVRKQTELSGRAWDFKVCDGKQQMISRKVVVPSCWETYPGLENYRGLAEYETTFTAAGNIRLEMKGVSHKAWVYIDGEEVVTHYNAYTPFDVIVRGLSQGQHHLKVKVDNSFKKEYALNRPNDYMSYGGISRRVVLEEVGDIFIKGIRVTPMEALKDGWWAKVEVKVQNISDEIQKAALKLYFHDNEMAKREIVLQPNEEQTLTGEYLFAGAEAWMPETPNLYFVKASLEQNGSEKDDLIERVGFRTIKVSENRVLINNKPIRIKGFCRHEDHPQYGCALPLEAMQYDLFLVQDMGANSIRTAHYPNDERFLDLCDELGILVWEEHHLRGGNEEIMSNPYFEPQCEQVIREMIEYHYNHPSIYIWGIMNECASETQYGRGCYEKQYALIRALDTSRPCSSASCKYEKDICLDLPDVVSWNMYPYWYEDKSATQMLTEEYQYTQRAENGPGKPFLITEIGAGAIYGFRSSDHDQWTEEFQAETLAKQLKEVAEFTECMGMYIWQFCDVRVNREWFAKRPRTRNNKGIVDEFRRRKLSYDVVKKIFTTIPNYWE